MRKASVLSAFLCGLSLLFLAATSASADPNAPGNNGTIKIHVVAGVQSGPQAPQAVAGVQNLPSTSTDTGQTPLVVLGVVLLATGVVLLRRPYVAPNP
jgi:LPXTG-motif cell wall-anchored protein